MKFDEIKHEIWIRFEIRVTINRLRIFFWLCPGRHSIFMKFGIHTHKGPIHIWWKFSLGPSCSFWDISSFLQGSLWKSGVKKRNCTCAVHSVHCCCWNVLLIVHAWVQLQLTQFTLPYVSINAGIAQRHCEYVGLVWASCHWFSNDSILTSSSIFFWHKSGRASIFLKFRI